MSYTLSYETDSNLVSSISMPSSIVSSGIAYTYDEFDRLITKDISISSSRNFYTDYEYYTYTKTVDEELKTYTTELVSKLTLSVSSNGTAETVEYGYTYDKLGNIVSISKNGTVINEYEYDALGQLVCEEYPVDNLAYVYTYDKAGNITGKYEFPYYQGTLAGDYLNYLTQYKVTLGSYTYSNSSWGDMLTNYNGTAITYDAIGNPSNWRNAASMSWDKRELTSLTLNDNGTLNFVYNSDGIRTKKEYVNYNEQYSETHNYLLDGTNIIREEIVTSSITGASTEYLYYLYDSSGSITGFIYKSNPFYFQKNLQGDIVRILNPAGAVVTEYTYDAWGNVISITGSLASTVGQINPFRYRGYYYDTETGFYYLQSRYYDPTVGRFLNADGIVGANGGIEGYNMFAYCNNSPIIHADYTGYDAVVLTCDGVSGHMGIMVQDEDGVWWHFYWGASDGSSSSYSFSSLWGCEVTTWCKEYVGVVSLDSINASEQYDDEYSRMLYLRGDFSSCINEMQNPSGKYNLFNNNCAQKSLRILASADTIYQDALELAADKWRPSRAHDILEENMPNQPPIPLLQNVKNPVLRQILRRIYFEVERLLCK